MKKIFYLFLVINLFIISACGSSGNSSSGSSNTVIPPYTISINGPDTVYTSSKNNYTITTVPEGIAVTDIEWLIDNETIAAIDTNGVLTVNNITGQVTITANANGKTATKLVNIIKQLEISGNNITAINGIITLKVLYNTTNNITWNSSNPAVATVENGVVTGVSAGSTEITVSENGNTSEIFTITIKDVPNGYETDNNGAYHVYSVAGFKAWREAVNTNPSTSLYLYSDLDFSSEQDNPMIAGVYKGTFNGNGHIIKNYTMTNSQGFFYNIGSEGKMLNVTFDNANATYTYDYHNSSAGLITCVNNGFIENVHIKNSQLTVNTNNQRGNDVGMFAARANVSTMEIVPEIKNCSITDSTLTVNKRMDYTGGIVGQALGNIVVTGCFVDNLNITTQGSTYNIAGIGSIVGQLPGSPKNSTIIGCGVTNTTIKNTVYNNIIGGNIGGFVGIGNGNVHASYFYGTVDNVNNTAAGLDFYRFSGISSDLYVKQQDGTIGTVNGQNTTKVDDTNVTWEQAVENMNKYLTDNGYTDFSFRYDENKGYPVIDYIK